MTLTETKRLHFKLPVMIEGNESMLSTLYLCCECATFNVNACLRIYDMFQVHFDGRAAGNVLSCYACVNTGQRS